MKSLKLISKALYLFIILTLILSVTLIFLFPALNLTPLSMTIASISSFILFLGFAFIWKKIYVLLHKYESWIYYFFLILLGIVLFTCSMNRTSLSSNVLTDYTVLSYSAEQYANGFPLESSSYYYSYFSHYNNNLKPMILLSWIFSLADFFHLPRFHFVLFCVCIQVVITAWSIGTLVSSQDDKTWRIPSLLFFALLLPLYGMTGAFYTDTMSMGLPVIAIALLKIAFNYFTFEPKNKVVYIFLSIIAAACVVLSIIWKITAIIPLIGYAIVVLLRNNLHKHIHFISTFMIALVLLYGTTSMIFNSYEITKSTKNTADPLISWVAIGLVGDGGFLSGKEFVDIEHTLEDSDAKYAYSLEYINSNKSNFWDLSHLISKFRRNFADGTLNTGTFTPLTDDDSIFWDLFNPYGEYYWRVCQITFCYMAVIYLSLLGGAINNAISLFRNTKFDFLLFSVHLSFLGILIFLMLWESNSRQMYNQMPSLILGVFLFIKNLFAPGTLNIFKKNK